jgi:hypothetical protein
MLDKLENAMNWLSDQDWGWWPFLFLRPKKHEDMSTPEVAKMSFYYGIPLGLIFYIIFRDFQWFLAGIVLFFVLFRLTFAMAWNRRARRLRTVVK